MSNNNNSNNNNKSGFQGSEISPYRDHAVGGGQGIRVPKTWSSERVPLSSHRSHRHVAASALMMPFSSGRTVPSKWVDAERWISSPVSVDNARTTSHLVHHHSYYSQRRTKSNSGPLSNDGFFSYASFTTYSPVLGMGVLHGGQWRNSDSVDSSANVGRARFEDHLAGNCEQGGRKSCPGEPDWLELWSGPLLPGPQGEQDLHNDIHSTNNEGVDTYNDDGRSDNDEVVGVDRIKSRREEMSKQMLVVEGEMSTRTSSTTSSVSSPKSNLVITTTYYCSQHPQVDQEVCENASQSPESQVKDVQVDEHISTTPKSNLVDTLHYNYDDSPSNSIVSNTHTKTSGQQREQVRIKAWENLQKAKAQAAIQKLEIKLEKKRSLSMDKIVEKLKKAEIKAQKMRSSLSKGNDGQIQRHTTSFSKLPLFCRKIRLRSSVRSCSTCYPF